MKRSKTLDFIVKHEVWLFYFLVLSNLIPLFAGTFFPSLDGPAHLYNSKLLLELINNPSSAVTQFFQLNGLVPNLSGHAIISLFMTVLPPHLAEKLFLIMYAVTLPLSFRYLLKSTPSANVIFSYFILPFVYSYLFLLGFYNFSISFVFMFLALGYWLKLGNQKRGFGSIILLVLLFFLTFTSHLVVYGLLVAFLIAHTLISFVRILCDEKNTRRLMVLGLLKQTSILLLVNLVPLFFSVVYFFERPQTGSNYSFISWDERISYIKDFRPLIAFNYEIEQNFTRVLFYIFGLLTITVAGFFLRKLYNHKRAKSHKLGFFKSLIYHPSLLAAVICFICLMAFLILPDSDGYGGYISVRMFLLFLIFLIYWFATSIPQNWIAALCGPFVIYVGINLNSYYGEVIKSLDNTATEIVSISDMLEPNSVVMPINVSNNWLYGHFSNYLGLTKPMVILENYEANSGYFPINWNDEKPTITMGATQGELTQCYSMAYPVSDFIDAVNVDYLFILGELSNPDDKCEKFLNVNTYFEKVYSSKTCTLYKIKGQ